MPIVYQRAAARRDLVDHFVYLAENVNLDTAEHFLVQAETTFDDLAREPKIGTPLILQSPELTGLRKWRVKDFDNYLIFYMPRAEGVSIVRVLYAAQDWWGLLGIDA